MAGGFENIRLLVPGSDFMRADAVANTLISFLTTLFNAVGETEYGFTIGSRREDTNYISTYEQLFAFILYPPRPRTRPITIQDREPSRLLELFCDRMRATLAQCDKSTLLRILEVVSTVLMNSTIKRCTHFAYQIARAFNVNIFLTMAMRTPVLMRCRQNVIGIRSHSYELGNFTLRLGPMSVNVPDQQMPEYTDTVALGTSCMLTDPTIRDFFARLSQSESACAAIELIICMGDSNIKSRAKYLLRILCRSAWDMQLPSVGMIEKYSHNFHHVNIYQVAELFDLFVHSFDKHSTDAETKIGAMLILFRSCSIELQKKIRCYITILLNKLNYPDVSDEGYGAAPFIGPLALLEELESYQSHALQSYKCQALIGDNDKYMLWFMLTQMNPSLAKLYETPADPGYDIRISVEASIPVFLKLYGEYTEDAAPEPLKIEVLKYPFVHTLHYEAMQNADPNHAQALFEHNRAQVIKLFNNLEGENLRNLAEGFVEILDFRNTLVDYMTNEIMQERDRSRLARNEEAQRRRMIAAHNADLVPIAEAAAEAEEAAEEAEADEEEENEDNEEDVRETCATVIVEWTKEENVDSQAVVYKPLICACLRQLDILHHDLVYSLYDYLTVRGVTTQTGPSSSVSPDASPGASPSASAI